MLRAVGHPVVVNPDPELARVAREEGWQVMRFDRLRRRLQVGVGVLVLGSAAAGAGALVSAKTRRPRSRIPLRRG